VTPGLESVIKWVAAGYLYGIIYIDGPLQVKAVDDASKEIARLVVQEMENSSGGDEESGGETRC
jgi:hypothetical protein